MKNTTLSFTGFISLGAFLLIAIIICNSGCKKTEENNPTKKLDYITDENGMFRLEFSYNSNLTEKMVYKAAGDSVVFEFENGLLSSEIHSNGNQIDFVRERNDIKTIRSWVPDEIKEIYHLDDDNRVIGLTKYTNGEVEIELEYQYIQGNITEQRSTFPINKVEAVYTYDKHPNPYTNIIVFSDFLTYSLNNVLTTNEETTATYQYDSNGDVIVAKYSEFLTYVFVYKWD